MKLRSASRRPLGLITVDEQWFCPLSSLVLLLFTLHQSQPLIRIDQQHNTLEARAVIFRCEEEADKPER